MSSNGSSSKGLGRREKAARFNVFGKHDEARSPKRRARGDKGPTNRYGRECRGDGSRLCEITNDLLAVWTGLCNFLSLILRSRVTNGWRRRRRSARRANIFYGENAGLPLRFSTIRTVFINWFYHFTKTSLKGQISGSCVHRRD
jgi:hypothetical protein